MEEGQECPKGREEKGMALGKRQGRDGETMGRGWASDWLLV